MHLYIQNKLERSAWLCEKIDLTPAFSANVPTALLGRDIEANLCDRLVDRNPHRISGSDGRTILAGLDAGCR
ncbi:unnamed protein product, partial [Iphiclides podalirius]